MARKIQSQAILNFAHLMLAQNFAWLMRAQTLFSFAFFWPVGSCNGLVGSSRRDLLLIIPRLGILPECVALVGSDQIVIGFKLTKARC